MRFLVCAMLEPGPAQGRTDVFSSGAASRCGQWMHGLALLAEMPQRSVRCDAVARDASLRASVKEPCWGEREQERERERVRLPLPW